MTGWIGRVIAQRKRGERAPRAATLPSTISAGGADDLGEKYEILDGGTNLATIGSSQAAPVVVDTVSISDSAGTWILGCECRWALGEVVWHAQPVWPDPPDHR